MSIAEKIGQLKYYVLRIELDDPDLLNTKCCVFQKRGEKLDPDHTMEADSLKNVISSIPGHANVMVLFTGNQVLTRYTSETRGTLFEEIEEEEFYLQKTISKSGWMIQSACRKSAIDPVLQQIAFEKRFVLDVSLSFVALPVLEGMMGASCVQTGHLGVHFKDGQLTSITEESVDPGGDEIPGEIELGDQKIPRDHLLHLAAIVHYFREGPAHISLLRNENIQSKFFRRFRITGILTLSGFFVLLLTNFLLYSHVRTRLSETQNSGENNLALVQMIEARQSEIKEYQNIRVRASSRPDETYAFYLEEIAASRPAGIWYNSLELHPCSNRKEHGKALVFDPSLFRLKGETRNPVSLNKLIGALESKQWINDIELVNYENTQEKTNASFELIILKR